MTKSGDYLYIRAFGTTLRDADGKPLRMAGALMDIDNAKKIEMENKKTMETIQHMHERVVLMLDTSPFCTQIWDKNLNTIDCNEAAVRLYGFRDKQEYRERFLISCSPEFQPDGMRSDEKATMLVDKAFTEGACTFDWMHQKPDGLTMIPAEVTLVRTKYQDEDVVVGYTRDKREQNRMMQEIADLVEEIQDMHDSTKAHLEKQVSERTRELAVETATLSTLLNSIPDLIFTKDFNLQYMHCNRAFLQHFGKELEDLIGKSDEEGLGLTPEQAKWYTDRDREVLRVGATLPWKSTSPVPMDPTLCTKPPKCPCCCMARRWGSWA